MPSIDPFIVVTYVASGSSERSMRLFLSPKELAAEPENPRRRAYSVKNKDKT